MRSRQERLLVAVGHIEFGSVDQTNTDCQFDKVCNVVLPCFPHQQCLRIALIVLDAIDKMQEDFPFCAVKRT